MFGDGNGPTYDWRRQPSSIWLKSVVYWTHNIMGRQCGQSGFPADGNCCARCLHCSNMRRRTIFEFMQSVSAMCWPLCSVSLRCYALTQKLQDMSVFLKRPFGTESMFVLFIYLFVWNSYTRYTYMHTQIVRTVKYIYDREDQRILINSVMLQKCGWLN